ncbi:hypothetical protein NPIL_680271 [Nephila pilipes]|uniref:Uncharacterized protein n=1 Tax=Nephila pilipes TaxID=299642 RepID=A0A8X6QVE1_NEPPI|nr:hypothetical protein NPIL_680271 [Nephila pilipes]
MKIASTKNFPKPSHEQNVKIKLSDIDRSKIDPKSVLVFKAGINDDEFHVLVTKFGKLKLLYTGNKFIYCKENFLNSEELATDEINVREVVKKLYTYVK